MRSSYGWLVRNRIDDYFQWQTAQKIFESEIEGDLSIFSPRFDWIFPGEELNPIFSLQDARFFGISFYITAFSVLAMNKFT